MRRETEEVSIKEGWRSFAGLLCMFEQNICPLNVCDGVTAGSLARLLSVENERSLRVEVKGCGN
ncbi:MAG TPA: hypothetical protein VJ715_10775 [Pyrinomonadaceae bacterium]|nr:hypothetical protein [Pyrinomonadaceae bacterium]